MSPTPFTDYDREHGWMLVTLADDRISIDEIAAMMHATPQAVRAYLKRFAEPDARAALRALATATATATPPALPVIR